MIEKSEQNCKKAKRVKQNKLLRQNKKIHHFKGLSVARNCLRPSSVPLMPDSSDSLLYIYVLQEAFYLYIYIYIYIYNIYTFIYIYIYIYTYIMHIGGN